MPHEGIQSGMARLWRVPAEVREASGQIHHELGVAEEENAALFPAARFHDHVAICRDGVREDRDADGYRLSAPITLMPPCRTAEDVSTLVNAERGLVVLTHLWWTAEGAADDLFAPDLDQLRAAREKVLTLGPALIVPGHGAPFAPSESTPL